MELTPELLLTAYSRGLFPMSESRDDPELFWVDPRRRGIFPLDGFHISRSLARRLRSDCYQATLNRAFGAVMEGCADRAETWINTPIRALYNALHARGFAHSIEIWENRTLIGGVYGVTMGGAFFGESMFSHRVDASKVALAYLVDHLRRSGFTLFDTQFLTPHLASLGAVEISRAAYLRRLEVAFGQAAEFGVVPLASSGQEIVQRNAQTS